MGKPFTTLKVRRPPLTDDLCARHGSFPSPQDILESRPGDQVLLLFSTCDDSPLFVHGWVVLTEKVSGDLWRGRPLQTWLGEDEDVNFHPLDVVGLNWLPMISV